MVLTSEFACIHDVEFYVFSTELCIASDNCSLFMLNHGQGEPQVYPKHMDYMGLIFFENNVCTVMIRVKPFFN